MLFMAYLLSRGTDPCQMCEMRINAAGNDFCVEFLEFINPIRECEYFSGTHKSAKIQQIGIIFGRLFDKDKAAIPVLIVTYKSNG